MLLAAGVRTSRNRRWVWEVRHRGSSGVTTAASTTGGPPPTIVSSGSRKRIRDALGAAVTSRVAVATALPLETCSSTVPGSAGGVKSKTATPSLVAAELAEKLPSVDEKSIDVPSTTIPERSSAAVAVTTASTGVPEPATTMGGSTLNQSRPTASGESWTRISA